MVPVLAVVIGNVLLTIHSHTVLGRGCLAEEKGQHLCAVQDVKQLAKPKTSMNEQMLAATKAAQDGLSPKLAAHDYGIPASTRKDHISGWVIHAW